MKIVLLDRGEEGALACARGSNNYKDVLLLEFHLLDVLVVPQVCFVKALQLLSCREKPSSILRLRELVHLLVELRVC